MLQLDYVSHVLTILGQLSSYMGERSFYAEFALQMRAVCRNVRL